MQRKEQAPGTEYWQCIALLARFLSFVEIADGCWIWRGHHTRAGYGQFGGKRKGEVLYAHRFSHLFYKGPIPKGDFVCHRCDNPGCVNPDHLFLGSIQDNNRDMLTKGRQIPPPVKKGADHAGARLTDDQVYEIRRRYAAGGVTQLALAKEFGISFGQVSRIARGAAWTHLQPTAP